MQGTFETNPEMAVVVPVRAEIHHRLAGTQQLIVSLSNDGTDLIPNCSRPDASDYVFDKLSCNHWPIYVPGGLST
jgi:hypothetical protein